MTSNYTEADVDHFLDFVNRECAGALDYNQAKILAVSLGKKQSSVIAKTRHLGLTYIPKSETPHIGEIILPPPKTGSPAAADDDFAACTTPTANDEETQDKNWALELSAMELAWQLLSLESFWDVKYHEFQHRLKKRQQSITNDDLFSDAEKLEKRKHMASELEHRFLSRMVKLLPQNFWRRLFGPKIEDITTLEQYYRSRNRAKDYALARERYAKESRQIQAMPTSELFGLLERSERLLPLINSCHHEFQRQQQALLNLYSQYQDIISLLSIDDLDDEIIEIERRYLAVRRSREWYGEFENLLIDVVNEDKSTQGENESRVRILQSDFLNTMKYRLPVYEQYFELRQQCFDRKITALIRDISFFESDMVRRYLDGIDNDSCHEDFELFTTGLREALVTTVDSAETGPSGSVTANSD